MLLLENVMNITISAPLLNSDGNIVKQGVYVITFCHIDDDETQGVLHIPITATLVMKEQNSILVEL